MARLRFHGLLLALLLLAGVAGAACSRGSDAGKAAGAAQGSLGGTLSDDDGKITLKVTWDGQSDPLVFQVGMDTHSVDLDGYDLAALSVLRTDRGEMRPRGWEAPKGGHHREGTLTFDAATARTALSLGSGASYIELAVLDVGAKPERVFRWDLSTAPGAAAR